MNTNNNIPEDDWSKLAPKLSKIPVQNPFTVPVGYFDALPTIISERAILQERSSLWGLFKQYVLMPRVSVSFGIIAVSLFFGIRLYQTQFNNSFVSQELAIENAVIADVDEDVLIETLADKEHTTKTTETEQYLLDNHVDASQLDDL